MIGTRHKKNVFAKAGFLVHLVYVCYSCGPCSVSLPMQRTKIWALSEL